MSIGSTFASPSPPTSCSRRPRSAGVLSRAQRERRARQPVSRATCASLGRPVPGQGLAPPSFDPVPSPLPPRQSGDRARATPDGLDGFEHSPNTLSTREYLCLRQKCIRSNARPMFACRPRRPRPQDSRPVNVSPARFAAAVCANGRVRHDRTAVIALPQSARGGTSTCCAHPAGRDLAQANFLHAKMCFL